MLNTPGRNRNLSKRRAIAGSLLLALMTYMGNAQALSADSQWRQQTQLSPQLTTVLKPLRHAQSGEKSDRRRLRSRNEVVREVKRRYDAEVLRISLNKNRSAYKVRILLRNGKVRNLQVPAYKQG